VSAPSGPAVGGDGPRGHPGRPHGLLEKLLAAVRPEFRADVLVFGLRDPVFGGVPCLVPGCGRRAAGRGLCAGHHQRWTVAGRPPPDAFASTADPAMWGHRRLEPCRVPGCRHGRQQDGLCPGHARDRARAGQPGLEAWLAQAPAPSPVPVPEACLVSWCDLWAHPGLEFCFQHGNRWKRAGRPAPAEFAGRLAGPPVLADERADLRALSPQLRLEMQYGIQARHDERTVKITPAEIRRAVRFLAGCPVASLLDWPEQAWAERFPNPRDINARRVLTRARRDVGDLAAGPGWEQEYGRDVWQLRRVGITGQSIARLRFDGIPQPWLKDLAKRWARWMLATGTNAVWASTGIAAVTRFGQFLPAAGAGQPADIDRAVLERYLADLHAGLGGREIHRKHIGQLSAFLTAIRQHRWEDSLPASAVLFPSDYPRPAARLPRALAEQVMAQVEDPRNLSRWDNPAYQLITVILIRCGLRAKDATRLPFDCITRDHAGAPYLRYFNHKMKREALVPVDDQLSQDIASQQQRALQRWPAGTPVLFPRPNANIDGTSPVGTGTYRSALHRWLDRCDIRDAHGQPVHLTPHQWRHTLGTVLINRDVPQHVVQKILDHDSPLMTAHYARLSDKTVREHWERARKVNAEGQPVQVSPDGPLGDAAWAKQQLSRATQALPNGYCQLPLVKTCPHANSCLTCPMFVTTAEFLPQHHAQRKKALQIITTAEAAGHARVAEMNRHVAGNLDKIIATLESEGQDEEAAADAS
jgi:integrase